MPNCRDITSADEVFLKVLLWAPTGYGKTTLIGTFPTPTYVFDCDGRIESLWGKDIDYDVYPIDSPTSIDRVKTKLLQLKKSNPYKTVALDGITALSRSAMIKAMPIVSAFMPKMKRLGSADMSGIQVPAEADFNCQMTYLREIIGLISTLENCHVIVTGHEKEKKERDTGKVTKVEILTTGALRQELPGFFNQVWRPHWEFSADSMGKQVLLPRIHTRPTQMHEARTTYPDALSAVEVGDYNVIMGKIKANLAKRAEALKGKP